MLGGPAEIGGVKVMVIAQQKGRNTEENLKRNFGCPNPEGYRKSLTIDENGRVFPSAHHLHCRHPGAYPGIGAEERHVAEAIA